MSPPRPAQPLRGNEDALFAQHHQRLLRAVRRAVRAPDACVEDACAYAWVQFLRRQPDRATAFAWLHTVAVREAWRLVQRERRDGHLEDLKPGQEPRQTGDDATTLEARAALRTLATLPPRQQRYLALLTAGYSYREILALCSTSYTNVNKHLARARNTLRALAPPDD